VSLGADFDDVVARALAGDAAAVERLYLDTVGIVRGYFAASRARDVDDLTNDVYVSMITSLPRFVGNEHRFRSWLLTIAHRRLVDSYRRNGRRPEDPVAPDGMAEPTPTALDLTSTEAEALSRLRVAGIVGAIDALTPDQRSVLLLRAVADLPVRDIAEVVGKPESAVKALLRRGVAQLERRLDGGDGAGRS
jgi:RNA polymerase sigma-70 factor (ECF subfamily)